MVNVKINGKDKPWWKSKTLWANVILIGSVILADVGNLLSTGQAVSIVAVLNIGLRAITKSGLKWTQ